MNPPTMPHRFRRRSYQQPLWDAYKAGRRRFVTCWHRRAGKDRAAWNFMLYRAVQTPGVYWYALPTYAQAKKIIWQGMDPNGLSFLDHIPPELVVSRNETELSVTMRAAGDKQSIIGLVGTDNVDRLVGTNPAGIVFSEYSLQRPAAWDLLRPILAENGGWALFNGTPRGQNHFFELVEMAQDNPDWFCSVLGVNDTHAIPQSVIDGERAAGMSEELIRQEFHVDFLAVNDGAYYARLIREAREAGRIAAVPYDPALPVKTAWDLGISDHTSIVLYQDAHDGRRYIDCYEASGEALKHYADQLKGRGYNYGRHTLPHDVAVRELGTGKSRLETLAALGIRADVLPATDVADGIEAVRALLPRCWFDAVKCKPLLDALKAYEREWDDRLKTFRSRPLHNWASHFADAFRYSAMDARPVIAHNPLDRYKSARTQQNAHHHRAIA